MEMFLAESREHLQALNNAIVKVEADPGDKRTVDEIFRIAHSFKGMSATMGFDRIATLTHHMEEVIELLRSSANVLPRDAVDLLLQCLDTLERMVNEVEADGFTNIDPDALVAKLGKLARRARIEQEAERAVDEAKKKTSEADSDDSGEGDPEAEALPEVTGPAVAPGSRAHASVRVDSERLDTLLHLIGEMVVHRSSVEAIAGELESTDLLQAVSELTRASQAVQEMVMRVRMIPVDAVFARLPRLVRDLSQQLDKSVVLELSGSDTELDRTAVDTLGDPLVHLVRNAVDHGIESPTTRMAKGKQATGRVKISARHAGGDVVISVEDDGRGISPAEIAAAAVGRGLITQAAADSITMEQALEFLFMPGFSTAEFATDISGRGIGMDAVRSAVRGFGGDVMISSLEGVGTTTEIRMPLTLAIMPALLVETAGEPYAIQLDRIDRIYEYGEVLIRLVGNRPTAVFGDRAVPVVDLAASFQTTGSADPKFMVIVRSADRQLALAVDNLVGQRELVTRAVPEQVRGDAPVSGGAVLANGDIALIVDCDALTAEVNESQHGKRN